MAHGVALPSFSDRVYGWLMRYRVLGPLEVSDGGRAIPLGGPKQRLVLANLLIRAGEVVPTDRLIDEIWADEPPEAVRVSLQSYVSHLRNALGPERIERLPPGYVLHAAAAEVDALRFKTLVQEGHRSLAENPKAAAQVLEDALALWRGPPFADLRDEPSLSTEVARLEEIHLTATEDRVEAELVLGRHAELVAELETLTVDHPLRERFWAHLIVALYRSDRQAEALDAYRRARTILSEELGIDPSPELQRLERQVLRQDPALEFRGEPLRGYQLVERIGEGAFGVVYRAYQPQVGREVAIKVIQPELANDPEFVRRFEAEAQLVAQLEHPHIVPLYDYWRDPDAAYLVMRLMSGGSLRERVRDGPLNPDRAAGILEQIASALTTAHRRGVAHRDVKPANILLDEDGNAYLSDFGIAVDIGDASSAARASTSDVVAYRSPEQIRGEAATPRSDLYALGVVLFEALAGRHPFPEPSPQALVERQLTEPLPSLRTLRPDIAPGIDDVVAKATAKDPGDRFRDPVALAEAFRAALGAGPSEMLAPVVEPVERNPYKGLLPFYEADARDFFGREALVERLVDRLGERVEGSRFLAVVGPSGCGKSSLIRAGLVPALRGGALPGSGSWFFVEMMPGARPFEELESALLRIGTNPPSGLMEWLERDEHGLVSAVERVLPPDGSELFLVIDQFEELFTLVDDEKRRDRFMASLAAATEDPRSRMRVVVTLRADFYDRPLAYQGFGDLLGSRTQTSSPLAPRELGRAIAGPAEGVDVAVEPALVAEAAAEFANHPGALPLFQYALTESFERRRDRELTLEAYRATGGMSGALVRRAEEIYEGLDATGRKCVRQVFLRLVRLGESIETRRRVPRTELMSVEVEGRSIDAVVDAFGSSRLLSFDRDPVTRGPTVEVAHEALLQGWDRLGGWIETARDDLRTHARLTSQAGEWVDGGRDPSFLLRGSRLEQLENWVGGTDLALSPMEREYVQASLRQRESEWRAEEAQRQREVSLKRRSVARLRGLVAVLAVGALVAGTLALIARDRGRRAEREARIAAARELAAAAVANFDVDTERSLLFALEAVETTRRVDGTVLPEAEEALHLALQADRLVLTVPGYSAEYSADGTRLLVVGTKGFQEGGTTPVHVHDAETGELIRSAAGRGRGDAVFSQDGDLFATSDWERNGHTYVWETATGEKLARLGSVAGLNLRFSPDGTLLSTLTPHNFTNVWDIRSEERVNRLFLTGPTAFSPNGRLILIADNFLVEQKAWLIVREARSNGEPPRMLLNLSNASTEIDNVAWSADGSTWAASNADKVFVWDAGTAKRLLTIRPPGGRFTALALGPGSRLATGMSDGTAIVWALSADSAKPVLTVAGHDAEIRSVSFSPDGTRVLTGSADGKIKAWDITPEGGREWLMVAGSGAVDFSPDGRLLATGSDDGIVSVYDAATGRMLLVLHGHTEHVNAVDFAPDGSAVASASMDGTTRIWDTASGAEVSRVRRRFQSVNDVAFSPDGRTVATANFAADHPVHTWDSETGELLRTLPYDIYDANGSHSVDFSLDGKLLAGQAFSFVYVWNPDNGSVVAKMRQQRVNTLAFSPDGRRLVAGAYDGSVRVWDPRNGRQLDSLTGTFGQVTDLAFSPDGTTIATSSSDGTVKLWDARTLEEILTLATGAEGKLAFSPDGTRLAFTTDEGTVRVLALDIDDLVGLARSRLTRSWTEEECRTYLHLDRCPRTPD